MKYLVIFLIITSKLLFAQTIKNNNIERFDINEYHFKIKVKQLNEFIERFNGEYKIVNTGDTALSDIEKVMFLIDYEYINKNEELCNEFVNSMVSQKYNISFIDKSWYSKLECSVKYNGKLQTMFLFMQIEADKEGKTRWVIKNVDMPFIKIEGKQSKKEFINPVNNEVQFSRLSDYIVKNKVQYLASNKFKMDYLSVFMYLVQTKSIEFTQVKNIEYVFYTPNYRFKVIDINRSEKNSGWLISEINKDNTGMPILNSEDLLRKEKQNKNEALDKIIFDAKNLKTDENN